MKTIFLSLLILPFGAWAEKLVSLESLMERPMDVRVREFAKVGDKVYPFLARTAFDKNESLLERWRAVTTMGRLDPLRFRPDLDKALNSPEWFMRNAALIALQTDERARAVAWSIRALEDNALVVRTQAVRNLIELNAREAEPVLWQEVSAKRNFRGKESLWIRTHIAEALARFATEGRTRYFHKLLQDNDERLHKWAIMGLETSTGMKLSAGKEPTEIHRQKWLARLGSHAI
jgi:hypothetical protein